MYYSFMDLVLFFNMRRFLYLIILCVILTGCKGTQKKSATGGGNSKPTVTVTIPPYQYFVEMIAGDKVDVNVMVPNGNNPETYEPYAQQMMELSKSSLYLKVGSIGFEQTWMKKLQDNAPKMQVIDTSTGITPAKTPGGNVDPHVWMSSRNARIISGNVLKALSNLLPEDISLFKKNYQALLHRIDRRDSLIKEAVTKSPEFEHKFVIYHPILTYFARDYHLEQLAIEEEGREPSAAQIKALIERVKKEDIKYCLIQSEFANRNTTTFIKESHTKPFEINPLQRDWDKAMDEVARVLQGKELVVIGKNNRR